MTTIDDLIHVERIAGKDWAVFGDDPKAAALAVLLQRRYGGEVASVRDGLAAYHNPGFSTESHYIGAVETMIGGDRDGRAAEVRAYGRGLIDDEAFDAELKTFTEVALDDLRDAGPGEDPMPTIALLHVDDATGKRALTLALIDVPFTQETKYETFEGMGYRFGSDAEVGGTDRPLAAVFFSVCAWVSTYDRGIPDDAPAPSDDPNRLEAMTVSGMTMDLRHNVSTTIYDRSDAGRPVPHTPRYSFWSDRGEDDRAMRASMNELLKAFVAGYAAGVVAEGGLG